MREIVLDLTPGMSQPLEFITDLASHRAVGITLLGKGGRSESAMPMETGSSPVFPGLNNEFPINILNQGFL